MPETELARPAGPGELFRAFNRLALQGFGGVLPVAQRELVERLRWLTREQFLELLSLSQVLPGPNIINLALIMGDRAFGWRGGVAALAGLLLAPTAIVLLLAVAASHWSQVPQVAGALRGMGVVAAGLVISTALRLAPSLGRGVLGWTRALVFVLLTVVAIGALRWSLPVVVLGLGAVSIAMAWRRSAP
jgi:chromate transporter